jgi:hypothetical protein
MATHCDSAFGQAVLPISEELNRFRVLLRMVPDCSCGQQLQKLLELSDEIQAAAAEVTADGFAVDPCQLFAWVMPMDRADALFAAVIRLGQIHKVFQEAGIVVARVELDRAFCEIVSWFVKMIEGNEEFVKVFFEALAHPFE